jgi:hypothetical protein
VVRSLVVSSLVVSSLVVESQEFEVRYDSRSRATDYGLTSIAEFRNHVIANVESAEWA